MPCCLVTGATGLIGSHLLPELSRDWDVVAVSRREHRAAVSSVSWLTLDLSEPWTASQLPERVDAVVHLAQSEHFREFPGRAAHVFAVNVASTARLLEYARTAGARRFVLASSGGVLKPRSEEDTRPLDVVPRDLGFYLGTKLAAEILADAYEPFFHVATLRFFFVYGPGQRKSMLIPRLVESVHTGRPITLNGPEGLRLNPTEARDAVAAVRGVLTLDRSCTLSVGGPEVRSMREIGRLIGQIVGREPVFEPAGNTTGDRLVADTAELKRLLGVPTIGLDAGLRRYVEATYA